MLPNRNPGKSGVELLLYEKATSFRITPYLEILLHRHGFGSEKSTDLKLTRAPTKERPVITSTQQQRALTPRILTTTLFGFICYLGIGLQLAVLPLFVHRQLNFGPVLAGIAISTQYVATLLSRPQAGRMGDSAGPKTTVLYGLFSGGISGILLLCSALSVRTPLLSLSLLLTGRLILGFGESWTATGATTWGMGRVGIENTAQVISWAGIASNGGLAIGAPLGVWMEKQFGLSSIAILVSGLSFASFLFAFSVPKVTPAEGRRLPFASVLKKVFPYGFSLALGTVGFGTITSFITLYYANRNWPNAALSLTLFGMAFVAARLFLSNTIHHWGGFPIAILSLSLECVGLICLWLAPLHSIAMMATAITGFGFSLVFPSLGVEAIRSVSLSNSGAALGIYTAFLDLSLGVVGPLAGWIASFFGFAAIYFGAALSVLTGMLLTLWLWKQRKESRQRARSQQITN